jgi:hypothetical protein
MKNLFGMVDEIFVQARKLHTSNQMIINSYRLVKSQLRYDKIPSVWIEVGIKLQFFIHEGMQNK